MEYYQMKKLLATIFATVSLLLPCMGQEPTNDVSEVEEPISTLTNEQIINLRNAILRGGSQDETIMQILAYQNITPITLDDAKPTTEFITFQDFITFFGFWRVQYATEIEVQNNVITGLVGMVQQLMDDNAVLAETIDALEARIADIEEDFYIEPDPDDEGGDEGGEDPQDPDNGNGEDTPFGKAVPLKAEPKNAASEIAEYMEALQTTNQKIDQLNEKIGKMDESVPKFGTDTISVDGETVITVLTPPAEEDPSGED